MGCAGVVVLQNWTPVKIDYALRQADGQQSRQSIAPTDIASIPTTGPIVVTLGEGPAARSYPLNVNSIHYFGIRNGVLELVHLKLPGVDDKAEAAGAAARRSRLRRRGHRPQASRPTASTRSRWRS